VARPFLIAAQLIIFVLTCGILYWAKFLLVPIALAIMCAFVLQPGVSFLERHRIKRAPAVGILIAVAISIVGSLGWLIGSQLSGLLSDIPNYRDNIKEKMAKVRGLAGQNKFAEFQKTIKEVEEELDEEKSDAEAQAKTEAEPGSPPSANPAKEAINEEDLAIPVKVVAQRDLFDISIKEFDPYRRQRRRARGGRLALRRKSGDVRCRG
jgi:hypothetical protein